jgi:F-type H+-transporting ATPase subunit b
MINSKNIKRLMALAASVAPVLGFAAVSFASSGGGEEGGGGSQVMAIVWQVLNFAILVAVLAFAIKKANIKGMLRERTELIKKSIDEAREAKELAQKALAEVEERLKLKDQEIERIISAARSSGESERGAAEEEGKKLSEKILEQAKTNIEFELEQAKAEIRAEAVELAMELARKKIGERLTPDEQRKLIEESLAKLEGSK